MERILRRIRKLLNLMTDHMEGLRQAFAPEVEPMAAPFRRPRGLPQVRGSLEPTVVSPATHGRLAGPHPPLQSPHRVLRLGPGGSWHSHQAHHISPIGPDRLPRMDAPMDPFMEAHVYPLTWSFPMLSVKSLLKSE